MARREPALKVKAIAGVNASRRVLRHFAALSGGLLRFTRIQAPRSGGVRRRGHTRIRSGAAMSEAPL